MRTCCQTEGVSPLLTAPSRTPQASIPSLDAAPPPGESNFPTKFLHLPAVSLAILLERSSECGPQACLPGLQRYANDRFLGSFWAISSPSCGVQVPVPLEHCAGFLLSRRAQHIGILPTGAGVGVVLSASQNNYDKPKRRNDPARSTRRSEARTIYIWNTRKVEPSSLSLVGILVLRNQDFGNHPIAAPVEPTEN